MVFAVWAGRPGAISPEVVEAFRESCRYGLSHIDEIVAAESVSRGFPETVVREYLTRYIVHELGERDYRGMDLFLNFARREAAAAAAPVTPV